MCEQTNYVANDISIKLYVHTAYLLTYVHAYIMQV